MAAALVFALVSARFLGARSRAFISLAEGAVEGREKDAPFELGLVAMVGMGERKGGAVPGLVTFGM